MRVSQREGQVFAHERNSSAIRKENMPFGVPSGQPATVVSFTRSPHSPDPNRVFHQWINVSNQVCSPKPGTRLIELGGSKEKREKAVSHSSAQTQANQSGENWPRKVALLQSRVKELHLQKQQLAVELSKRLQMLEVENQRLIHSIGEYESGKTSSTNGEFDLEEELSHQINVNLELREQLQATAAQMELDKKQAELQAREISNLGEEKAELKLQLLQLQDSSADEIASLGQQLEHANLSLEKKDESYRRVLEEREKRILELEEESFSLQSRAAEKDKLCEQLQGELSSLHHDHQTAKSELQHLHEKVFQLQQPSECKKCKDLMHTVFRLNSQLNKK